jgi:YbbR domain-containing protein
MKSVFTNIQRFIKKSLTENLGLKMTALVIAMLLFTLVRFQEESDRLIDVEVVPLEPEEVTGMVLTSELPETVRLRVHGPRSRVEAIKPGDIRPIEIDLRQEKAPRTKHYYLAEESFQIPAGVSFVRVTPESLQIKIERLVSRRLPVRVTTYGKLEKGCEFEENPSVNPRSVAVIGPASAMKGIKYVETEDVDVNGLAVGEHPRIVSIRPIEGVSVRQSDGLNVSVKVRWIPGQRMISGLLVQPQGEGVIATFRPKEVAVALTGPQVALDRLDPSKIKPVVALDVDEIGRIGIYRGDVAVQWLPENVRVTSVTPQTVEVRVTSIGPPKSKKVNSE